jgi:hypothetical protein
MIPTAVVVTVVLCVFSALGGIVLSRGFLILIVF